MAAPHIHSGFPTSLFPTPTAASSAIETWRKLGEMPGKDGLAGRRIAAQEVRSGLGLDADTFRTLGGIHGIALLLGRKRRALAEACAAGVSGHDLERAERNPIAFRQLPMRTFLASSASRTSSDGGSWLLSCCLGIPEKLMRELSEGEGRAFRIAAAQDDRAVLRLPVVWTEPHTEDAGIRLALAAGAFRQTTGAGKPLNGNTEDRAWTDIVSALEGFSPPLDAMASQGSLDFRVRSGAVVVDEGNPSDNDPTALATLLHAAALHADAIRLAALACEIEVACPAPNGIPAGAEMSVRGNTGIHLRIGNLSRFQVAPGVSLRLDDGYRPSGLRLRFIEA